LGALTGDLRDFLDAERVGVLATIADDDKPASPSSTTHAMARGC
jgi:hypothetical protein